MATGADISCRFYDHVKGLLLRHFHVYSKLKHVVFVHYPKDNGAAVEITTKDSQGNYILVLPAGNYSANTFNFYQIDLAGNKSINQSLSRACPHLRNDI